MAKSKSELAELELIDTCWNVNICLCIRKKEHHAELIDTCWNVNLLSVHTAYLQGLN